MKSAPKPAARATVSVHLRHRSAAAARMLLAAALALAACGVCRVDAQKLFTMDGVPYAATFTTNFHSQIMRARG